MLYYVQIFCLHYIMKCAQMQIKCMGTFVTRALHVLIDTSMKDNLQENG